jgi:hypothetical protein
MTTYSVDNGTGNNTLYQLNDTNLPNPIPNGHVLSYSTTQNKWITSAPGGGGGATTLQALTDTNIIDPVPDGHYLAYSTFQNKWVPTPLPAQTLESLTDTTVSNPLDTHFLVHDGTSWVNRTSSIVDHSDVSNDPPNQGDVLFWNSTLEHYQPAPLPPTIETLDALIDVNLTAPLTNAFLYHNGTEWVDKIPVFADLSNFNASVVPTNGEVLTWNSTTSKYEPTALGGGGATDLNGLGDVIIATPVDKQSLIYNGTSWVNRLPAIADCSDYDGTVAPFNKDVLTWNSTTNKYEPKAPEVQTLAGLVDVNLTAPLEGFLYVAGGIWTDRVPALADLSDIDGTIVPIQGDVLTWNDTTSKYEAATLNVALDELSDTLITGAQTGEILIYNGTEWVNAPLPTTELSDVSNIAATIQGQVLTWNTTISAYEPIMPSINTLGDVVVTAPMAAEILIYNGTEWINAPLPTTELSDVNDVPANTSGSILVWDQPTLIYNPMLAPVFTETYVNLENIKNVTTTGLGFVPYSQITSILNPIARYLPSGISFGPSLSWIDSITATNGIERQNLAGLSLGSIAGKPAVSIANVGAINLFTQTPIVEDNGFCVYMVVENYSTAVNQGRLLSLISSSILAGTGSFDTGNASQLAVLMESVTGVNTQMQGFYNGVAKDYTPVVPFIGTPITVIVFQSSSTTSPANEIRYDLYINNNLYTLIGAAATLNAGFVSNLIQLGGSNFTNGTAPVSGQSAFRVCEVGAFGSAMSLLQLNGFSAGLNLEYRNVAPPSSLIGGDILRFDGPTNTWNNDRIPLSSTNTVIDVLAPNGAGSQIIYNGFKFVNRQRSYGSLRFPYRNHLDVFQTQVWSAGVGVWAQIVPNLATAVFYS